MGHIIWNIGQSYIKTTETARLVGFAFKSRENNDNRHSPTPFQFPFYFLSKLNLFYYVSFLARHIECFYHIQHWLFQCIAKAKNGTLAINLLKPVNYQVSIQAFICSFLTAISMERLNDFLTLKTLHFFVFQVQTCEQLKHPLCLSVTCGSLAFRLCANMYIISINVKCRSMQALQTVHKPPTVWKGYSPISNFNAHPTVQTPEVYFFHSSFMLPFQVMWLLWLLWLFSIHFCHEPGIKVSYNIKRNSGALSVNLKKNDSIAAFIIWMITRQSGSY